MSYARTIIIGLVHRTASGLLLCLLAAATGGCGIPSFLVTPVQNVSKLEESEVRDGCSKKIVIIPVEGMILGIKTGSLLGPTENDLSLFTQELEKAEKDSDVAAIVLRINSPGGTVTASDTMYQMLLRFRQRSGKPIVASTQEMAASGGYYIACAADRIVAHPTSVVGSIGVIFNTFDASGTLGMIGIKTDAIKSGPMKDMGSPLKPLDPRERALMQAMVDEYFARFKSVVTSRRNIKPEDLETVTDGRVFSGENAVKVGLVDQTGLLDDAIDLAEQLSGAKGATVVLYKHPYGYTGSIYARESIPPPQAGVLHLDVPQTRLSLPAGFYFLWEPAL